MHWLVATAARALEAVGAACRWVYLLGREVRVHRHRGHPTTVYLTTQIPPEEP